MSKIMECQSKTCKFTWMAKQADYCPRCKGMEIAPKAQKTVGTREPQETSEGGEKK